MIREITELRIAEDGVGRLLDMIAAFKAVFLSVPGGIGVRCLQDEADPCRFVFFTEWDSEASKARFMEDPRLLAWATAFAPLVVDQVDRYFQEVA